MDQEAAGDEPVSIDVQIAKKLREIRGDRSLDDFYGKAGAPTGSKWENLKRPPKLSRVVPLLKQHGYRLVVEVQRVED